jgi:hypothetical protein
MAKAAEEGRTRVQRKRHERVTINHEFTGVDAFISEYVTNISRSGVFIRSKQPLPIGTKVNLRFTVLMDDIETIEGVGEVVRVTQSPSGMGVVFRTLTSYSEKLIETLMVARGANPEPTTAPSRPEPKARR